MPEDIERIRAKLTAGEYDDETTVDIHALLHFIGNLQYKLSLSQHVMDILEGREQEKARA